MKAVVRRYHSPDVDDLETWFPAEPECFGLLLQVLIGPVGAEGEESFDFVVCSPDWLKQTYGEEAVIIRRHQILMFEYDSGRLKQAIESLVAKVDGESWSEVATKLARYGGWEFEDYA